MGEGEWEPDAENWVRWARTPGHDAYWLYRDDFFDCILPPRPGRRTLEIGCGEGRVARDLQARGHRVVALDTAFTLVRHAHEEVDACLVADGSAMPFPAGSFDTFVAYNVLQVVADMAGTVREVGRVLSSGGHLCIVVAHPVTDLGRFVNDEPDSPFALREAYYESRRVEDRVERDGIGVTLRGWTHSLQAYARRAGGWRVRHRDDARTQREGSMEERPDVPEPAVSRLITVEYRDGEGRLHEIELEEAQVAALTTVANYTGSDLATVVAEWLTSRGDA